MKFEQVNFRDLLLQRGDLHTAEGVFVDGRIIYLAPDGEHGVWDSPREGCVRGFATADVVAFHPHPERGELPPFGTRLGEDQ